MGIYNACINPSYTYTYIYIDMIYSLIATSTQGLNILIWVFQIIWGRFCGAPITTYNLLVHI